MTRKDYYRRQSALFRKFLKEEVEGGEATSLAKHQQAQEKYRERQSNREGWGHAAFFGPASAIEEIKRSWEHYKRAHPELWTEPED